MVGIEKAQYSFDAVKGDKPPVLCPSPKNCELEGHTCKDSTVETCEDGEFDTSFECDGYWAIQCCVSNRPPTQPPVPSTTEPTTLPVVSQSAGSTLSPTNTTQPLYGDCGRRQVESSQITNGREATPHSWPWQASLRTANGATHNCGAVLISDRWVLTAAHCINSIYDNVATYRVVLGTHYQFDYNANEYSAHLEQMIPHHLYDQEGPGFPYDIALLKLDLPVPFNRYIQPVCLPLEGEEFTTQDECFLTGWGDTRGTGDENVLNEVQIEPVANADCAAMWARYPNPGPWIYDFHICAGDGIRGSCSGDSGGPMVCRRGSQWILAGVSSWAMRGCDTPGFPSVYSRITSFLAWINENTNV
ncbi:unnamed protein product [Owenia fusiformis]|uniref:Peptidase S1 domain-containing protein n=1 Tax=Owenia fusiformis TaxID=6347 RepID=A0A8S4MZ00_OWEFU|nr:unnamed protein product [Owenia fusiformis]